MFRQLATLLHRTGIVRPSTASMPEELEPLQSGSNTSKTGDEDAHERIKKLKFEVRRLREVLTVNAEHREARHQDAALEFDRVSAHVSKAIATASMETEPIAHVVIDSLFPDDTYLALLDAIPPDPCFTQRDKLKQNFIVSIGDVVPEFSVRVWTLMEQAVIPKAITPALVKKFQPHIEDAYAVRHKALGPRVATLPHEAMAGRLMLRRPGYHLDPHFDPQRVIVTCLLYLARPGDSDTFGTQFFSLKEQPTLDRTNTFYPGKHGYKCKFVKTVAFKPNTAVAFLNYGLGAHGADIPTTAPGETKRFAYQFYISPAPALLAALIGSENVDQSQA